MNHHCFVHVCETNAIRARRKCYVTSCLSSQLAFEADARIQIVAGVQLRLSSHALLAWRALLRG